MIRLAPKLKVFVIVLIGMIALHVVLSFFGCIEVTRVSRGPVLDIDGADDWVIESVSYTSLLPRLAVITAALWIVLILVPSKVCQVLSCLLGLAISALTSSVPFLMEASQLYGGLGWTHYCLSPLGIVVVTLLWVSTIFNIVLAILACRSLGERPLRARSTALAVVLIVLIALALIIFRNVLIDEIKQLLT